MFRIVYGITILLIWFLSQTAVADGAEQVLSKQSFAFSTNISTGKQSVRQFELPYEVLRGLQRQDYGDMRIFNSQNQSIPFSVKVMAPQSKRHSSEHELDFFTLPENPQHHNRLQIEIDKYISRFNFSTMTSDSDKHNYIVIKNPYNEKGLDKLKLHWKTLNHAFSLKLKLEQSDDLEHWRTVKYRTTLYDLQHNSTMLIKDTIFLPRQSHAKYLRLSFSNQNSFLHSVTKISGYYSYQSLPELENWKTLTLQPGEMAQEWLFNTESVVPIVKIGFDIPQTGLLYQGTLFSKYSPPLIKQAISDKSRFKKEVKKILLYPDRKKPKQHDPWQYRQGFTQYRLLTESGEINSQVLLMPGIIKDSEWRIVLKQPLTLLTEQVPKIKIGWYPVVLTFLAQGNGPYRLLFGNPDIKSLRSGLIKSLTASQTETVMVAAVNAVEKSVPSTEPVTLVNWFRQMNWQKNLLWLLLCSFVLLMGTMAYKLYLRMNK